MVDLPRSDLDRAVSHEAVRPDWPLSLHIVAVWPNGKTTMLDIEPGEFYGVTTGAPMTGGAVVGMIERLVRTGQPAGKKR